jgi:hypothetical protein
MKKAKIGLGVFLAVVLIESFFLSPAHAQHYPDLGIWLNQWFKVSITIQDLYFSDIGAPPDPRQYVERGTGYLVLANLAPFDPDTPPVFTYRIYVTDGAGGWYEYPYPLDLNYVGGDVSNFAGWSYSSSPDLQIALVIQIKGTKKKDGTFTGATIKTLGGYHYENDAPPERWLGSMKFSGTWVNTATLCKSEKNSTLPPCSTQ